MHFDPGSLSGRPVGRCILLTTNGIKSYGAYIPKYRLSRDEIATGLGRPSTGGENAIANFDEELDASGLNCPLPILRAKKALNTLDSGKILRIIATDPGSVKDFEAFAKQTGNALLESKEVGGKYEFLIKKA